MFYRKKLFIILLLISTLLLSSCSTLITGSEAEENADKFFEYISKGQYDEAEAMFHPDITITEGGLESLFYSVKLYASANAKNGITAEYTGRQSVAYSSDYGGGYYRLNGILTIDECEFDMVIEFIKRDDVFGIYNFNIDIEGAVKDRGSAAAVNM